MASHSTIRQITTCLLGGGNNDLSKLPIACRELKGYVTDLSDQINSVTNTTEQWSIKYEQGKGLQFNNDTTWTGEQITSGQNVMTNNGDVIPSAYSSGFQSFAFGGKRFDKARDNSKITTNVSGNQSFAAGGGVEVTGNFAAAFCKQSGAYQEACFAANGGKAGDESGDSTKFVGAAAFNSATVKGVQCSGFGAAQIDANSKNTLANGASLNVNACEACTVIGHTGTVSNCLSSLISTYRSNVSNVQHSLVHISSGTLNSNNVTDSVILSYGDVDCQGKDINRSVAIGEDLHITPYSYLFGAGLTASGDSTSNYPQTVIGRYNEASNSAVVIGSGSAGANKTSIEIDSTLCKINTPTDIDGKLTCKSSVSVSGTLAVNTNDFICNSSNTTINNAVVMNNTVDIHNKLTVQSADSDITIKGNGKLESSTEVSSGSLQVSCAAKFKRGMIISSGYGFYSHSSSIFYSTLRASKTPVNSTDVLRLADLNRFNAPKLFDNYKSSTDMYNVCAISTEFNDGVSVDTSQTVHSSNLLCGGLVKYSSKVGEGYQPATVGDEYTPVYFEDGVPYACKLTMNAKKVTLKDSSDTADINLDATKYTIISVFYYTKDQHWKPWEGGMYIDSKNRWNINFITTVGSTDFYVCYIGQNAVTLGLDCG